MIWAVRKAVARALNRLAWRFAGITHWPKDDAEPKPAPGPRRQLYVVAVLGMGRGVYHLTHVSLPATSGEMAEHQAREMTVPYHPQLEHWVFSVVPLRRSMVGSDMAFSQEQPFVHEEVGGQPVIFEEED